MNKQKSEFMGDLSLVMTEVTRGVRLGLREKVVQGGLGGARLRVQVWEKERTSGEAILNRKKRVHTQVLFVFAP